MPGLAPASIIVQVVLWHKHLFFFCSSFQPILQQCLECHPCFHIQVPLGHFREHFNRRYKLLLLKALFFCWEKNCIQSHVSGDFVAHNLTGRSAVGLEVITPQNCEHPLHKAASTLAEIFSWHYRSFLGKEYRGSLGRSAETGGEAYSQMHYLIEILQLITDQWVPNHFINLMVWDCKR